jgi:hypothetical protein
MRHLIWAFVIVSPMIAFVQGDSTALSVPADAHLAATLAAQASVKMADALRAAHVWLA